MKLFTDQSVLNRDAGGGTHRRDQAVLFEGGPVLRTNEVKALTTQACGHATHVVERQRGIGAKIVSHEGLFDAALALDYRLVLNGSNYTSRSKCV